MAHCHSLSGHAPFLSFSPLPVPLRFLNLNPAQANRFTYVYQGPLSLMFQYGHCCCSAICFDHVILASSKSSSQTILRAICPLTIHPHPYLYPLNHNVIFHFSVICYDLKHMLHDWAHCMDVRSWVYGKLGPALLIFTFVHFTLYFDHFLFSSSAGIL